MPKTYAEHSTQSLNRWRREIPGRLTGGRSFMPATRSNIVVGVDGSPASDAAVRWAAREAITRVAPIKLINVVAPTLASSAMAPNHTITQGEELRARQILRRQDESSSHWPVRSGRTSTPSGSTPVWCRRLSRHQTMRRWSWSAAAGARSAAGCRPGHRGAAPPCELRSDSCS